jgi:hypothetical protein
MPSFARSARPGARTWDRSRGTSAPSCCACTSTGRVGGTSGGGSSRSRRRRRSRISTRTRTCGEISARALRELSARQRACVVLYYYLDLPVQECADLLDLKPGAVKRYLYEARSRLAERLGPPEPAREEH